MDDLIASICQTARDDGGTQWFDVVKSQQIAIFESALGVQLPELLNRCYSEISNGGFGPGYHLAGLPGGCEAAWGNLALSVKELRNHEDCEHSLLPLIDWGCNQVSCVDCDDGLVVTFLEGDFHHEEYTLDTLLARWCEGEIPDLRTGEFRSLA